MTASEYMERRLDIERRMKENNLREKEERQKLLEKKNRADAKDNEVIDELHTKIRLITGHRILRDSDFKREMNGLRQKFLQKKEDLNQLLINLEKEREQEL